MGSNLAKEQRYVIIVLSAVTFLLALAWISQEAYGWGKCFSLEPVVTSFASFIPIVTLFWPFKPKYKSKRASGTLIIPMYNTDKIEVGDGEYKFIPTLTHSGMESQHFYVRHPSLQGSAIVNNANQFSDVKDASSYSVNKEDKTPNVDDIVLVKNRYGKYALFKIIAIRESKSNVKGYEVEVEYIINTTGGLNFS
ncbi:hypothetical protein RGJ22_001264 [Serratia marcescens]|nr:hypothetical protein [Serratia marcescens]